MTGQADGETWKTLGTAQLLLASLLHCFSLGQAPEELRAAGEATGGLQSWCAARWSESTQSNVKPRPFLFAGHHLILLG